MAYEDVLGNGEVGKQPRLLMHDGDAERTRVRRSVEQHRLAVEDHAARIGLVDPRQQLDYRALAGTVLSHERVDLAGQQIERDVRERLGSGEALGYTRQCDWRGRARGFGACARCDRYALSHDRESLVVCSEERLEPGTGAASREGAVWTSTPRCSSSLTIPAGASSSVTTAVSLPVGQKVANADRPHFV